MTAAHPGALSPAFKSLYRLFLRSASVSVLHKPRAVKALRQLYRPVFRDAAQAIVGTSTTEKQWSEDDMRTWDARMDETLSLLYNSARFRGLSHNLTKNLAFLISIRPLELMASKRRHWNGQLSPDAKEYQPRTRGGPNKAAQRLMALEGGAYDGLREVMEMAEDRDGLVLGKLPKPVVRMQT